MAQRSKNSAASETPDNIDWAKVSAEPGTTLWYEQQKQQVSPTTQVPTKALRSLQDRWQRYDLGVCGTAEVMMALRSFFKEVQEKT